MWSGQVEAQAGGDVRSGVGGRIEAGTGSALAHHQIAIALETGCHGPFDFQRVVDVNVLIHHIDMLAGTVPGESRFDGLPAILFGLFVDLDDGVQPGTTAGKSFKKADFPKVDVNKFVK